MFVLKRQTLMSESSTGSWLRRKQQLATRNRDRDEPTRLKRPLLGLRKKLRLEGLPNTASFDWLGLETKSTQGQ